MNEILVYVDKGAWFSPLLRALLQTIDPKNHVIRAIGAWHILNDATLFKNAKLLVMPGGADRPYCAALDGPGNKAIRQFVEEGGNFLGICAGAYYACSRLIFRGADRPEIKSDRELGFFQGTAIGTISEFGPLYDMTKRSASTPLISLANGQKTHVYYNGGPYFLPDPGFKFTTLASYGTFNDHAAIIETQTGKGRVILTGVHLEISAKELSDDISAHTDQTAYQHLVHKMTETELTRLSLWQDVLTRLGLCVKND